MEYIIGFNNKIFESSKFCKSPQTTSTFLQEGWVGEKAIVEPIIGDLKIRNYYGVYCREA